MIKKAALKRKKAFSVGNIPINFIASPLQFPLLPNYNFSLLQVEKPFKKQFYHLFSQIINTLLSKSIEKLKKSECSKVICDYKNFIFMKRRKKTYLLLNRTQIKKIKKNFHLEIERHFKNFEFFRKLKLFENFNDFKKTEFFFNFSLKKFPKNNLILAKGQQILKFFIIRSVFGNENEENLTLAETDFFGDEFLWEKQSNLNYVVESDFVEAFVLSKLFAKFSNLFYQIAMKKMFFNKIFDEIGHKNELLEQIELKTFHQEETLEIKENVFYFCLNGKFENDKCVTIDSPTLITKNLIVTSENTEIIENNQIFLKKQGNCLGKIGFFLVENAKELENKILKINSSEKPNSLSDLNPFINISTNDIILYKELGKGSFGNVYLAKYQNYFFALKAISKAFVMKFDLQDFIEKEKKMVNQNTFPFTMKMLHNFEDEYSYYFMMEYLEGELLFNSIRNIGLLNSEEARFFIATLIISAEALHKNGFIHRDIKPDNIIVDLKGFAHLIDFGCCKQFSKNQLEVKTYLNLKNNPKFLFDNSLRTKTMIGTPHYMAPEMFINENGYSFPVDLWAIGVCLFEFVCGYLPFGEEKPDPFEIYYEILNKKLKFPKYVNDRNCRDLIKQLLNKKPLLRYGKYDSNNLSNSYDCIKKNAFFDHFDWEKLTNLDVIPPYTPKIKKNSFDEKKCIDLKKCVENFYSIKEKKLTKN